MFHEINAHVAHFARHTCVIEVTLSSPISGPPPVFVAEAFVREKAGRDFRPIVWRAGDAVAIHSDSEWQAVSGILRVLEHHLGPVEELVSAGANAGAPEVWGDPWPLPVGERHTFRGGRADSRVNA